MVIRLSHRPVAAYRRGFPAARKVPPYSRVLNMGGEKRMFSPAFRMLRFRFSPVAFYSRQASAVAHLLLSTDPTGRGAPSVTFTVPVANPILLPLPLPGR